jgi:hypothetical protein
MNMNNQDKNPARNHACLFCGKELDLSEVRVIANIDKPWMVRCECGYSDVCVGVLPNRNAVLELSLNNGETLGCVSINYQGESFPVGAIYSIERDISQWHAYRLNGRIEEVWFSPKTNQATINFDTETKTSYAGGMIAVGGIGLGSLGSKSQSASHGHIESSNEQLILSINTREKSGITLLWKNVASWRYVGMQAGTRTKEGIPCNGGGVGIVCPNCLKSSVYRGAEKLEPDCEFHCEYCNSDFKYRDGNVRLLRENAVLSIHDEVRYATKRSCDAYLPEYEAYLARRKDALASDCSTLSFFVVLWQPCTGSSCDSMQCCCVH